MTARKKKIIFRADMINVFLSVRHGNLKHQSEGKIETHDEFATVEESYTEKVSETLKQDKNTLVKLISVGVRKNPTHKIYRSL